MYPETKHVSYSYVLKSLYPEHEHYPYVGELCYEEYELKNNGYTNSIRGALKLTETSADNVIKVMPHLTKIRIQTTIEEIP